MSVLVMRRSVILAGTCLVITGALAACTSGSAAPASTTSASVRTSAASVPPASTPPTTPNRPAISACTDANLSVSYGPGPGQGPNGAIAASIVFANTSAVRCRLSGYPGVDVIDPAGHTLTSAVRTLRGPLGGLPPGDIAPPHVDLGPGARAIADIEGRSELADCTSTNLSLRVAIPDTAVAHVLTNTWSSCQTGLFIHPVMSAGA